MDSRAFDFDDTPGIGTETTRVRFQQQHEVFFPDSLDQTQGNQTTLMKGANMDYRHNDFSFGGESFPNYRQDDTNDTVAFDTDFNGNQTKAFEESQTNVFNQGSENKESLTAAQMKHPDVQDVSKDVDGNHLEPKVSSQPELNYKDISKKFEEMQSILDSQVREMARLEKELEHETMEEQKELQKQSRLGQEIEQHKSNEKKAFHDNQNARQHLEVALMQRQLNKTRMSKVEESRVNFSEAVEKFEKKKDSQKTKVRKMKEKFTENVMKADDEMFRAAKVQCQTNAILMTSKNQLYQINIEIERQKSEVNVKMIEQGRILQQKKEELQKMESTHQELFQAYASKISNLETNLSLLKEEESQKESEVSQIREQKNILNESLFLKEREVQEMSDTLEKTRKEVQEMEKQLQDLKTKLDKIQKQTEKKNTDLMELTSELQAVSMEEEEKMIDLQTRLKEQQGQLQSRTSLLEEKEKALEALNSEIASLTLDNETVKESNLLRDKELEKLHSEVKVQEEEIEKLNFELKQKITAFEETVAFLVKEKASLDAEKSTIEEDVRRLESQVQEIETDLKGKESELNQAIEAEKICKQSLETIVKTTQQKKLRTQSKISELEASLESMKAKTENQKKLKETEIQKLESQIKESEKVIAELLKDIVTFDQEQAQLQKEMHSIKEQLEKKKKEERNDTEEEIQENSFQSDLMKSHFFSSQKSPQRSSEVSFTSTAAPSSAPTASAQAKPTRKRTPAKDSKTATSSLKNKQEEHKKEDLDWF